MAPHDTPLLSHRRYEAREILGSGGQGVVLRVRDREQPSRALVAKVWRSKVFDESALAGEFALLARIRSRGLASAHDFGKDEVTGAPFLVEDYIDGRSAASWIGGADGPDKLRRLVHLLADCASTLVDLHDAGFSHGDLKPAHVRVVEATDAEARAIILDLGSAVSRARGGDAPLGFTAAYAAPEVRAGGRASAASDLYGLGALLWALATGEPPVAHGRPLRDAAPWIPPSVAEVIDALVAIHPSDRPESARQLLRRIGSTRASPRHPPAPIGRDRELAALVDAAASGVRYLTGASGSGKSLLLRELVTSTLLAGRDARLILFPLEDDALVLRLIAFFRGETQAWPFVTGGRPDAMLLALDELHAAPAELASSLESYRCRLTGAAPSGPAIVAANRSAPPGAPHIALGPLGDDDFRALARALGVIDPAAIEAAARSSNKSPGWLVASVGRVPATRDTVLERVRGLSQSAAELLGAIAIAGGDLSEAALRHIAGDGSPADLAQLLAEALVRRTAFGSTLRYALVAPTLAPEIASAIASFDLCDRVADALLEEGDGATSRSLLSAASSPESPARREELLERAAMRARATGLRTDETEALLALAANPKLRTRVLLCRLERLARDSGTVTHPQVLVWLDEAGASDAHTAILALRRRAEKHAREGDPARAEAAARSAIEAARKLGDPGAEGLALATLGAVALYRADWTAADAALGEARARLASVELEDVEELARLDHNAGVVGLYRGRIDDAVEAFERSLARKRRLGDRAGARSCLLNLGIALAKRGQFDHAVRALDEAAALARSLGQGAGLAWSLAARADVEIKRKDAVAAERWIAEAEALGDAVPAPVRADLLLMRADVALLEGDGKRARARVADLDATLVAGDAMIALRASIVEAAASLATIPADPRAAARAAIRSARRAREAMLPEMEGLALDVLRAARRPPGGQPASKRYAPLVQGAHEAEDIGWSWLAEVAAGVPASEATIALARLVVRSCGAERAFIVETDARGEVLRAWGTDLEGIVLDAAERRVEPPLVRAALAAVGPVYQRDVETVGGRGSRVATAGPKGAATRVVVIAEHRFRPGSFDGLSSAVAMRWAMLAAVARRLAVSAAPGALADERERPTTSDVSSAPSVTTAIPLREARRSFPQILGASPALRKALARLDAAIDSTLPVLIVGDTGVGKELFARALHEHGPRADGPFVAVNCGAIPDALFEAELFGHAKGSFTGADRARSGLFARADGGTLLLDEIGDLPLARQAALLRVLESRTIRPVGSDDERPFDVRVVAATHRDLEAAVAEGRFRRDLFFRLNVIELRVPPLRDREGDVAVLARSFLDRAGSRAEISAGAMAALAAYPWPGNVRELEHRMQRLAASRVRVVALEHLPREVRESAPRATQELSLAAGVDERADVERALAACAGNISQAARELGLTRHGLKKRMARLGMRVPLKGSG